MLSFMKVPPTTYVLQYKHGKIKREGAGLSFFYWAPTSTIVAVPLASADVPFVFPETTADFQSVTIQGQLTYGSPTRSGWHPSWISPSTNGTRLTLRTSRATDRNCRNVWSILCNH